MADDNRRAPSPPLPPDPSTAVPRLRTTNQGPADVSQQPYMSPSTPSREQAQPMRRVDSSQSPVSRRASSVFEQRQPIRDAVNYAASNVFQYSPATNQMDPDIVRQITAQVTASVTEQVLKNLHAANATPTPSVQPQLQTQFPPPPPPQQWHEPRSPARSSIDSNAERFTPPTPERNRSSFEERIYESSSPEPASDAGSSFSRESRGSIRSNASQRSMETPRPFQTERPREGRKSSYTTRKRSGFGTEDEGLGRQGSGSDSTARDQTPFRRDSRDSEASYDGSTRSRVRPPRVPSDVQETTTLEKIWQPLFDNGNPTMRLSQFLRGLALHIIDDYEPKGSLVVTRAKMLQFLNETKVEEELYPWDIIFGGKLTPISISKIFQKLLCQHHLVQDRYDTAPTIPGLTPAGFDWFMTCLIQAHPDTEFERLAKAVMNMPISNADNKSERFPKELSRRLLPAEQNLQAAQRLISSLNHEPYIINSLKGTSAMPPPPPPPSAPPNTFNNERERKPYSSASQQSNAFDDDDLGAPPPVQIERERKPYSGKEGAGKTYDEGRPMPSQYKPEPTGGLRNARTNSGVPPQAMYSSTPSDPVNIPQRQPHRMSAGQGSAPIPAANGNGRSKSVRRSPPRNNNYARGEPEFVGSVPASQLGSNLHPNQQRDQYSVDPFDDDARRYRSRSRVDRSGTQTNGQNDDDTNGGRGYPIPGRSSVNIGNSYEYGGTGTPVGGGPPIGQPPPPGGGMPVGSFPSRRPTMPSGNDDRRRSMYAGMGMGGPGNGGTDGYGSFAEGMNGGPGYTPQQQYGSSVQH